MNRETIINRPLDIFRKAMLFLLLCVLIASCSKEDVITEETGITGTPHFTWDIAVELEQPNNWCTAYPPVSDILCLSKKSRLRLLEAVLCPAQSPDDSHQAR